MDFQGFRGIANTILFALKAKFAVTEVPLLNPASTTNVPSPSAAIMRFLAKKLLYFAFTSFSYSVRARPLSSIILLNRFLLDSGNIFSNPHGKTAIVFPPYFKQVL